MNISKEEMLYQLLRKEHGFYKTLEQISQEESLKIGSNAPMESINSLLKRKRIIISCINEVEKSLIPLKHYWQNKSDRSDHISQKIKLELESFQLLLKKVLDLDLINQKKMQNHLVLLKDQCQTLKR